MPKSTHINYEKRFKLSLQTYFEHLSANGWPEIETVALDLTPSQVANSTQTVINTQLGSDVGGSECTSDQV